jgi:hypothetical protein
MKIEIAGIIKKVGPVMTTKNNKAYIEIILEKRAYVDEFGESKGKAQFYKMQQFKNEQSDFNQAQSMLGKKAKVTVFLNGTEFPTNEGLAYGLHLNVKSINIID